MTEGYRFRVDDGGKLVLQVKERPEPNIYYTERTAKWRDATVEDIPVVDPFGRREPRTNCFPVDAYPGACHD